MARATPTKATNELKEKLRREEEKVFETIKLYRCIFKLELSRCWNFGQSWWLFRSRLTSEMHCMSAR